ncbi:V-type ATPase assembly factor PKR1 [Grifola frondosa]|uniref:V-type ATPase assembly factor PKR1 n=1 Tax=Grifola frondosa TaxID=5627 RepID=A0A1C7M4R4_GRIFR|nr:V-type ATPase assembly factor PKR1 [Grifola frondosa]
MDTATSSPPASPAPLWATILEPGSSLHPTLLLLLDGAFALLLFVFIGLLFLTRGNVHLIALVVIECCLWASVKWFVHELQQVQTDEAQKDVRKDSPTVVENEESRSASSKHKEE